VASNPSTSRMAAFSRLFWMLVGPAILSLLGLSMAEAHRGWFAPRSVIYLGMLIAVVLARWFGPIDSNGQPTTPRQRQMELTFLIALGIGGWLIANALGFYWRRS
jgi:hypothetical protein